MGDWMPRIILLALAALIIALLPLYEKGLNGLLERAKAKLTSGTELPRDQVEEVDEEDILSNKNKWRMLIIGYCVFVLFMIFATVSIVTLNTKLNNLSAATGDIMDRLSVLEMND